MAEGAPQSIVIKKVKKGSHGGHHGGAWKIAYADFVTAMMAFFLLLWLLNAIPQESLEGLSNYFAPVSVSETTSGSGGVLGGTVIAEEEGAGTASSSTSITMELQPVSAGSGGSPSQSATESAEEKARERAEQQQIDEAEQQIQQAVEADEDLEVDTVLQMESTPEGLNISLLDEDQRSMFTSGGSVIQPHARKLLAAVAKAVKPLPQQLAISGHTDSTPFTTSSGYSNWELSSDRANSARRELMDLGIPYDRIAQVVGKADTDPFLPENPTHASNRRLRIVLLRGTGNPSLPKQEQEQEQLPGLEKIKQEQIKNTRDK